MAVTYIEPFKEMPGFKMPFLHKVPYNQEVNYREIEGWLKENCKDSYYPSPGWHKTPMIEFEDDEDAMMFALRWGA